MPYSKILHCSNRGLLALAGLSVFSVFAPAVLSGAPAGGQHLPAAIDHQYEPAHSSNVAAGPNLRLAKVIVLKNDPREAAGSSRDAYQPVAPRLQSRIRKNSEFAAFVKLVRATSKREYTARELRDLYLSFREWSRHHRRSSQ